MKRSLLLILCLVLAVVMVSCGQPEDPCAEGHSFAEAWKSDATNHWHAATCEHTDEKSGLAAHTGLADDGVCDVCEWSDVAHEHEFDDENWSSDATFHWHASTCGHSAVVDGKVPHTYEDGKSGCTTCGYGHKHTYSDEWTSDENGHWNVNTCEHAGKINEAAHTDTNNDGDCDTCGYNGGHVHTYDEENVVWLSDTTTHWNPATCGHDVKLNVGYHLDVKGGENDTDDGKCDVCGVQAHSYSTEWTTNKTHHYHLADCGCCLIATDVAAHVDADDDGACDDCKYYLAGIGSIIEGATSTESANKVNKVTVVKPGYYGASTIVVEFGNGVTYIDNGEYETKTYYLPYLDANGANKLLALQVTEDGAVRNYYDSGDSYYGYSFDYIIEGVYGVEEIVKAVYAIVNSEENAENIYSVYENYDATEDVYTIAFTYYTGYSVEVYSVGFTVDEGVITEAAVLRYSFNDYAINEYEHTCYVFDEDPYGTMYMISQETGDRTLESPYNAEDYIIDEFTFGFNGEAVENGDEIDAIVGLETSLEDTNGVLINFADSFGMVIYADAEMTVELAEWTEVNYGMAGTFTILKEGTYYAKITSDLNELNFVINAKYNAPTTITPTYFDEENYSNVSFESMDLYAGMEFEFFAKFAAGENPAYTALLLGGNDNATLAPSGDGNKYVFSSSVVGEYIVVLKSTVDETVSAMVTINVLEIPNMADVLNGKFTYSSAWGPTITVVFTPAELGALKGEVTVNFHLEEQNWRTGETIITDLNTIYNYEYSNSEGLVCTYASGDNNNDSLVVKNYKLVYVSNMYGECKLEKIIVREPTTSVFPYEMNVAIINTYSYEDHLYYFTAYEAGVYNFYLPAGLGFISKENFENNAPEDLGFYDNAEGGTVSKYLEAGETLAFYVASVTLGDYTITVTYGEGVEEEPEVVVLSGTYKGTTANGVELTITFDSENGMVTFSDGNIEDVFSYTYENGTVVLSNRFGSIPPMTAYITVEGGVPVEAGYYGASCTLTLAE